MLTLLLIHQLIDETKHYFSFEKITTIDVIDNINDDYPTITLLFQPNVLYTIILGDFKNYLDNKLTQENREVWKNNTYCIWSNDIDTFYTAIFLDCPGNILDDIFNHKLIERVEKNLGIYFKIFEKTFKLSDINDHKLGWVIPSWNQMPETGDAFFMFLTLNFDEYLNITKNGHFIDIFNLIINRHEQFVNMFLHTGLIPNFEEFGSEFTKIKSDNYTLLLTKTLRTYLESPFGNCSHYSPKTDRLFNASSYKQCYRNCLRSYAKIHFNCIPLMIDRYFSENDFGNEFRKYLFQDKTRRNYS